MEPETVGAEARLLAALGYPMGIIALIVLLTGMKRNRFLRFHAIQALAYVIAGGTVIVGLSLILTVISAVISQRSALWPLVLITFPVPLVSLTWIILSVRYAVRAYRGDTFRIPLLRRYTARYLGEA